MMRKNQMIEIKHSPLCNTKNNHFVPQFYLKSFQDRSGFIYCFDKVTNTIHQTRNLKEIGCQKNLYTITTKISQEDVNFFSLLFKIKFYPLETDFLKYLTSFLNDEFKKLFNLKYTKNKNLEIQINEIMGKMLNSPDISRNQELLFGFYETKFQPIYKHILDIEQLPSIKDSKINPFYYLALQTMTFIMQTMQQKLIQYIKEYDSIETLPIRKIRSPFNDEPFLDCIHYLIIQYWRTRKILKSPLLESIKTQYDSKNINIENVMFLALHFHGLNIIKNCIDAKYKLYLIKNLTELAFITSDNPAVNPYSVISSPSIPPENFEIFFPLSPKLGILYSNCCLYASTNSVITIEDKSKIDYWNRLLLKESERFVYGNSKSVLECLGD